MMETPTTYLPIDRLHSLLARTPLPDRTVGAALFTDLSGFTRLTEALVVDLGANRGAEELTRHLNLVYDALISELHRYAGSVISFAGDAITCWFDGTAAGEAEAALRAATCALAMQARMQAFALVETPSGRRLTLAMKSSLAAGPARRCMAGDPEIQMIDLLAGQLLMRLSDGEHVAERGETLVDQRFVELLGSTLRLGAWRTTPAGERFAVLEGLHHPAVPEPWPAVTSHLWDEDLIRPWLLRPVYQRLANGQGEFLSELRPAVVLFLRFDGIAYDSDDAATHKLDGFIRFVQHVLVRYGGSLLQVAIGDKGSYLYAAFGALHAHEDDSVRAVSAAFDLVEPGLDWIEHVRIGISQGRMRTGAYGGIQRRTYGVIGDAANIAARLMEAAQPGQILVSEIIRRTADSFVWNTLPPILVKGKETALAIFSPHGPRERRALRLQEAHYALPMIGRRAELQQARQCMEHAIAGQGQIVALVGEAGTGKSRLMAEIIRLAEQLALTGYGSGCESYGTNTSYLVWHAIWQHFFGVEPSMAAEQVLAVLQSQLHSIDPGLPERAPLLGAALNIDLPDNELTASFDAKLRKASLEALLVDCLRERAQQQPLLLLLEDCHWLDPLSHDLLEVLARAIAALPVLIVVAYRPPEVERLQAPRVMGLPHATTIRLTEFSPLDAEELIQLKLAHSYGAEVTVPPGFSKLIVERAQGNPFYIEELINFLKDREIDLHNQRVLAQVELPNSLHSLILSRIDQLTERQQVTLKIASTIGRMFHVTLLRSVYPQPDAYERLNADLETLSRLELTLIDSEPELAYLFKHIVTQEVAYESLPYATRAQLHEQIGLAIERQAADTLDQVVNLLAFHFSRSTNLERQRVYLLRAGELAQADYANAAALEYYERVLSLLPIAERVDVTRRLAQVLELLGRWDAAAERYQQALYLAEELGDQALQARIETSVGELLRKRGRYAEANECHAWALAVFEQLGDAAGVAQVLHYRGTLAAQQGNRTVAQELYEASLAVRRELDDKPSIGSLLSNLGIVARNQGDLARARALHEEGLAIRRQVGNRWAIANSLNNLGNVLLDQGEHAQARMRLEEAVLILRQIGDRWAIANALNNLGNVARTQQDYAHAQQLYDESFQIAAELGDRWALAYLLEDVSGLAAQQGQAERALTLLGAAAVLREAIGAPLSNPEQANLDRLLAPAYQLLLPEQVQQALAYGRTLELAGAIHYAREPI